MSAFVPKTHAHVNHSDVVDTLRGLALLGIFVVNIQSYLWGLSGPSLGLINAESHAWDSAALLLIATIFEFKTYPIFCFCFGYGFAVLARKWRILGVDGEALFARRLKFMLVLGIFHGVFIWFGDILARYAIAGFVLKRGFKYGGTSIKTTRRRAIFWVSIFSGIVIFFSILGVGGTWLMQQMSIDQADANAGQIAAKATHAIYLSGDYLAQTRQRFADFFWILLGAVLLIPTMLSLFLLGALAAQSRALTLAHLPRFKLFWQRVALTAMAIGAPLSVAYGYLQLQAARSANAADSAEPLRTAIVGALGEFGPVLAMGYIAIVALQARSPDQPAPWLFKIFAPAGRVALSFYISQSLLMLIFLNGLFPTITFPYRESQLGLLGLSVVCYTFLLAVAHGLMRYRIQGPLEYLWRKYTNQKRG